MTTRVEIYCVKCRAQTDSREVEGVKMKNGSPGIKGICRECGTRKFKLGGRVS